MRIEKPTWVQHTLNSRIVPIFSVDIHPDQTRIATGGADNQVKIWALGPILDSKLESDDVKNPKLLCSLSQHQMPVNSVKWSLNGDFLASGSDDKTVCVYKRFTGTQANNAFSGGSNGAVNIENWKRVLIFTGHNMDIQDICWSPCSSLLASCSIDNTIRIWKIDSHTLREGYSSTPIQILKEHEGWVKGVAWDPIGKYLLSTSEDGSVIVWSTSDWSVVKKITAPFLDAPKTSTFFRRVSWSADGSSFAASNASKDEQNLAVCINRKTWGQDVEFVGHEKAVVVVKFNPVLFHNLKLNRKDKAQCCVVGSLDCKLSVWMNMDKSPLVVLDKMFDQTLSDVSWNPDGYSFIASSLDGTIACVQFHQLEIGKTLTPAEQQAYMQNAYGDIMSATASKSLVESVNQLEMEEKQKSILHDNNLEDNKKQMMDKSVNMNRKQRESRTNTGKRRITPVLVVDNNVELATSISTNVSNPAFLTPMERPNITPITSMAPPPPVSYNNNLEEGYNSLSDSKFKEARPSRNINNNNNVQEEMTLENGSTKGGEVVVIDDNALTNPNNKEKIKKKKRKLKNSNNFIDENTTLAESGMMNKKGNEERNRLVVDINADWLSPSYPLDRNTITILFNNNNPNKIIGGDGGNEDIILSVDISDPNATLINNEKLSEISEIKIQQGGKILWRDRVAGRVIQAVIHKKFVAVATANGLIYLYDIIGRRTSPPIVLGWKFVSLVSSQENDECPNLMAVNTKGDVIVWNVDKMKCLCKCNLNGAKDMMVISGSIEGVTFHSGYITPSGCPVITISGKPKPGVQSFTFDSDMQSWLRIADQDFVNSDYYDNLNGRFFGSRNRGPLNLIQSLSITSNHDLASSLISINPQNQRIETRSHLENQLAASERLASISEYIHWLRLYIKYLISDSESTRLRQVCLSFLGPLSEANNTMEDTSGCISIITKRQLLKSEILPIISTNRGFQRLVNEMQELLRSE